MKKKINYKAFLVLLISLFSLSYITKAQVKNEGQPHVVVNIVLLDSTMLNNASIDFDMCKDGINSNFTVQTDMSTYKITGMKTQLSVPLSGANNYGRIIYNYKHEGYPQPFDHANNLFIFQNGDSIQIYLTKHKIAFKGKGSDKYKCLSELYEQQAVPSSDKAETFYKDSKYEDYINTKKAVVDSCYQVWLKTLHKYKIKMPVEIYSLVSADLWGYYNHELFSIFKIMSFQNSKGEVYDSIMKQAYVKTFSKLDKQKISNSVLANSYQYGDFLYVKEELTSIFSLSPNNKYSGKDTFKQKYDRIRKNYTDILKDKVIFLTVIRLINTTSDTRLFLKYAVDQMGDNVYQDYVQTILNNNVTNAAYNFSFQDENGKLHHLNDFKEKLVVMDFWFTGCTACKNLAVEMKPIIESYKSNPDVIFITVNIDKNKEEWKESVLKEEYSSKEELNLHASLGGQDPIIKYYSIIDYPTLIVISKEGKIISTAPPKPKKSIKGSDTTFIKYINQHI